jgi:hypothetical protein
MRVEARLLPLLVVAFEAHGVVLPAPAAGATPPIDLIKPFLDRPAEPRTISPFVDPEHKQAA